MPKIIILILRDIKEGEKSFEIRQNSVLKPREKSLPPRKLIVVGLKNQAILDKVQ